MNITTNRVRKVSELAVPFKDRVPMNWSLMDTNGDILTMQNVKSGEVFVGTKAEFNTLLSGIIPDDDTIAKESARKIRKTNWHARGDAADHIDQQTWFSDLGAMGYSDGVNWHVPHATPVAHKRPRLLPFGNSISQQSCSVILTTTTTVASEHKAGVIDIAVTSAAALSVGDKIALALYSARIWTTTITAINVNTITVASPTPGLLRLGALLNKYTLDSPYVNMGYGIINAGVSLLGGPVEVVPGYGYGGALCVEMINDLVRYLDYYRPQYCAMHLWENDLTSSPGAGTPLAQLLSFGRWAARECLDRDCTPILFSAVPRTSLPASRAADFDAILDYCLNQLHIDVPGAIGADASTHWLDTSNPSSPRSPTAGWTDGVHPVVGKLFEVGRLAAKPVFSTLLPAQSSLLDYVLSHRETAALIGTSGTNTNFTVGSIAPTNCTIQRLGSNGAVATSTRNADGSLKITGSWPNAASRTGDQILIKQTFTYPAAWAAGGQYIKCFAKFKSNSRVGMSQILIDATINTGEEYTGPNGVNSCESYPTDGTIMMIETPAFRLPKASVSVVITLQLRPDDASSPANAAVDIDLIEFGALPAYGDIPL